MTISYTTIQYRLWAEMVDIRLGLNYLRVGKSQVFTSMLVQQLAFFKNNYIQSKSCNTHARVQLKIQLISDKINPIKYVASSGYMLLSYTSEALKHGFEWGSHIVHVQL